MKKTILTLILCVLCLVSCNDDTTGDTNTSNTVDGSSTTIQTTAEETPHGDVDLEGIAAEAVSKIDFSLPLEKLAPEALEYYYSHYPAGTSGVIYSPGAASAEEFAIFHTHEPEALLDVIEVHRNSQRASYSSYKPSEVEKIDNAVIVQSGHYVVFCISEDHESAKKTIEELLK